MPWKICLPSLVKNGFCSRQSIHVCRRYTLYRSLGGIRPFFDYSDTWQLIVNTSTTIITFLMVFLIQNSQNRDSCALLAKLDEILHALKDAREDVIGIEHLLLKELEKLREEIEEDAGKSS